MLLHSQVSPVVSHVALELLNYTPGLDTLWQSQIEIGNISPHDYVEDGFFTRICTQFNWGTRYNAPFHHSQEALNSVVSTLGKLGK